MTSEAAQSEVARCPEHSERESIGTCSRCGRFVCEGCPTDGQGNCAQCTLRLKDPLLDALAQPFSFRSVLRGSWKLVIAKPAPVLLAALADTLVVGGVWLSTRSPQRWEYLAFYLVGIPTLIAFAQCFILGALANFTLVRHDPWLSRLSRAGGVVFLQATLFAVANAIAIPIQDPYWPDESGRGPAHGMAAAFVAFACIALSHLVTVGFALREPRPLRTALTRPLRAGLALPKLLILELVLLATRSFLLGPFLLLFPRPSPGHDLIPGPTVIDWVIAGSMALVLTVTTTAWTWTTVIAMFAGLRSSVSENGTRGQR